MSVSEAKAQLTDLVRRAEAGEDVVLTRHGRPTVRLVPANTRPSADDRRKLLEEVRAMTAEQRRRDPHFDAARSQDFLYGEDGLPA